jgi:uncharacterized protein (TIGR02145 family)
MKTRIHFTIFIFFFSFVIMLTGCEKTKLVLATITTIPVSQISYHIAVSGGEITDDGGASILEKGLVWNTIQEPTLEAKQGFTTEGGGLGTFSTTISGLAINTKYCVRAYATNSVGTTYGNQVNFTTKNGEIDIDGNEYNIVQIGTQIWLKENLKTTKYRNGNLIGTTTSATLDISSETTPKYQWAYDGNESNVATYGRLYTWYAVTDSRNVCPVGWHIPSDAEWTTLTDYLTNNGYGYQGSGSDIAKSMAVTFGWTLDPIEGNVGNDQASNNSSGFTALPSGVRSNSGPFYVIGNGCYWWSSTERSTATAYDRIIVYNDSGVHRNYLYERDGCSVRCLKDN